MNQLVNWLTHFICQRDFIIGITGSYGHNANDLIRITINASVSAIISFTGVSEELEYEMIAIPKTTTIYSFPGYLVVSPIFDYFKCVYTGNASIIETSKYCYVFKISREGGNTATLSISKS